MSHSPPRLGLCVAAEVVGTFLLVFFGLGAVHAAVLTDALTGLWQVGVVWGLAIMFAAYTVGDISGAHINPAMTLALWFTGRFPAGRVGPYIAAQFAGAFLAAAALFAMFEPFHAAKEAAHEAVRGDLNSVVTAMCFGEYFPNPGALAASETPPGQQNWLDHWARFGVVSAAFAEWLGTGILAFVVFALSRTGNASPPERFAPVFIGLTVTALICVIAPLTQACFNPARDFGPRLFAWLAGWGQAAFPGPNGLGCLVVYLCAPILGAVCGGSLHDALFRPQASQTQSSRPPSHRS